MNRWPGRRMYKMARACNLFLPTRRYGQQTVKITAPRSALALGNALEFLGGDSLLSRR
jgi:hypothetical protein